MWRLDRLEASARELAAVFEGQGECHPGLRSGESCVYGTLQVPEIHGYIEEAVEYAAQEGAVLVLALLGHGFTPGLNSSHLYFMGKETRPDSTLSACDVPQIVRDAADFPNSAGTVVVIDTCVAAGAVPDTAALVSGAKIGGKRLTMLMGCAVFQEGIDMIVSRSLAAILRSGSRHQGEHLTFAQIKPELERRVPAQDLSILDWDSAQGGAQLWAARNAAWSGRAVRTIDHPHLHEVLAGLLTDEEPPPASWDAATCAGFQERLSRLPSSMERDHAMELIANVDVARRAKLLLSSWLGAELTTPLIRRGLELAGYPLRTGAISVGAALSHLADGQYSPTDHGCQRVMAGFVIALGWAAHKDLDAQEVRDWAEAVDAVEHVNDAIARYRGLDVEANQPRLIISLASFTDGWPEEVAAWLLRGGERLDQMSFPCPGQDEVTTVKAVVCAVRWGLAGAKAAGGRLTRVEVAAREGLLLRWCPEEVDVGSMLGVSFDVTLRWSEQINPPEDIWWVNDSARGCLEKMSTRDGTPPVAWLSPEIADDRDGLHIQLLRGKYQHKALTLDHRPTDPGLLRMLKAHSAVVLWPSTAQQLSVEAKQQMSHCWHKLRESVREAFRAELRDEVGEVPGSLRAVWDDLAWLDFCDNFTPLRLDARSSG
jgi:hypothetical protein